MSYALFPTASPTPKQSFQSTPFEPPFSKALSAPQAPDAPVIKAEAANIEVRGGQPDPTNFMLPTEDMFQIVPAENMPPGFAANTDITRTVFASFRSNEAEVISELAEILEDIDDISLALYTEHYHPDGPNAHEREDFFNSRIGNHRNVIYLPSEEHRPQRINDSVSLFPEDGKTYMYGPNGEPRVLGFSEERQAEVRESLEQTQGNSLIHPQRSEETAYMTARMLEGLEAEPLEYLTYGGDFYVGNFNTAAGDGFVQKQFFGAESVILARERIFNNPESLPPHLSNLNLEQQHIYALAKIMEEIEGIAGTASEVFPLGSADTTIGETLATLPDTVINDISADVMQRLEALADYPLPLEFSGNRPLNYHVDIYMVPLTDNIVLVDETMRGDRSIEMLLDDDLIEVHFLPSKSRFNNIGEEIRVSYINMLTVNDGNQVHLILQTENRDRDNLTPLDMEVRAMLEELGFEVHFVSLTAEYGRGYDFGLNCLTETASFEISR